MRLNWRKGKAILLLMAPGLIIGGIVGAWPGYRVYEYVWKDADFCATCHVHDYATHSWRESVHGKQTTCHDCHHQPLHQYVNELAIMITRSPKFPRDLHHTPYVPKDLCQACHLESAESRSTITGPLEGKDVARLPKVDRLYLHRVHLAQTVRFPLPSTFHVEDQDQYGLRGAHPASPQSPARPVTCVDCHGAPPNRAHHFTATERSCTRCHEGKHESGLTREAGCRTCHFQDFMKPELTLPQAEKSGSAAE